MAREFGVRYVLAGSVRKGERPGGLTWINKMQIALSADVGADGGGVWMLWDHQHGAVRTVAPIRRRREIIRDGEKSLASMFFLQMPVMLARGISDISLYNISNYATPNNHVRTPDIDIGLAE